MMNSLLVLSAKKYLRVSAVLALPCLALPVYAQDQEPIQADQAAQETERQQRIQELRQLQREERAERRQVIQAQLDTLTEEQKAALQERRQMQRRARNERMARGPQRRSNRCQCDESGADATDS
jgi:uncharacterized membrane protein YqiK